MRRQREIEGAEEAERFMRTTMEELDSYLDLFRGMRRAAEGTAEEPELWKIKMAQNDVDSTETVIIASDHPPSEIRATNRHELKKSKHKKKKAKGVPEPLPIPDLIVPEEFPPQPEDEGRFMRSKRARECPDNAELSSQPEKEGRFMKRKRAIEDTTEEAGFRDSKRAHNDAEYAEPSERRAMDHHELKMRKLKKKKGKGVQKDLPDPQCNSELVNCEKPALGSISSMACNLSEDLCAVTGSSSQKDVISKILVSFLENILKLNQSEACSSKDNAMSQASHCIMKHATVLVQLLQMNLKDEKEKLKDENKNLKDENKKLKDKSEKLKDENEKLKDETKNLKDEKKNLQRGIEAVLSEFHLK